jgi:hypothetical protein
MLKGTRMLIGKNAKTYVDTIATLRECLLRG